MAKSLPRDEIWRRLNFLHSRLPKHPTAVSGLYSLPEKYAEEVANSNFSQSSLQTISDHIGYFLGLLGGVTITLIEEPKHGGWVGTSDGIVVADEKRLPIGGMYRAVGPEHNEILLIKKQKYEFKHILAILAHECTHNYLYHYRVRESEESENEILTELATAYLGLGHLLLAGYEPISWTSNEWDILIASGHTVHITWLCRNKHH